MYSTAIYVCEQYINMYIKYIWMYMIHIYLIACIIYMSYLVFKVFLKDLEFYMHWLVF